MPKRGLAESITQRYSPSFRQQSVFEPELLALFIGGDESLFRKFPVIGMEGVNPAKAEAGFRSLAGELVPRLAQIGSKTPSGSVIHTVTGALSAMLRKRASLSRNATSTCFRSLMS